MMKQILKFAYIYFMVTVPITECTETTVSLPTIEISMICNHDFRPLDLAMSMETYLNDVLFNAQDVVVEDSRVSITSNDFSFDCDGSSNGGNYTTSKLRFTGYAEYNETNVQVPTEEDIEDVVDGTLIQSFFDTQVCVDGIEFWAASVNGDADIDINFAFSCGGESVSGINIATFIGIALAILLFCCCLCLIRCCCIRGKL